jgi:hypothetical protein
VADRQPADARRRRPGHRRAGDRGPRAPPRHRPHDRPGPVDSAQGDVESAARAAVQAAVVQSDPADAQAQAAEAVTSTLAGAGLTCPSPQVTTDTQNFVPGGLVSVTVTCVTSLADVTVPGVPGSKTLSATSTAHIDPFRAVS